jgi:ketosteroid isomerase-like protein
MAADDVAIIRALLRAPSADAFYEGLDAEVEWDASRSPGAPAVVRGRDEVRAFLQRWRHGWEHWRFEADDFLDAGDRIVTIAAPAGVDPRPAAVWTVRDGKVVRFVWYQRESEARADAGLDQQSGGCA